MIYCELSAGEDIAYLAMGVQEKEDFNGILRPFLPGIYSIGDFKYTLHDSAMVRLETGTLTIAKEYMTNFSRSTREFFAYIKLSKDDSVIFSGLAVLIDRTRDFIVLQLKTILLSAQLLTPAPDISNASSYTQGRFYPRIYGRVNHFYPLLVNDSTYEYYSGGTYVSSVYDDGVVIPFNNITTTYDIDDIIQYNGYAYKALVNQPQESPTGGDTNNDSWQYQEPASTQPHFESIAYNFTLLTRPAGDVTCDVQGNYSSFVAMCASLITRIPYYNEETDTVSFSAPNKINITAPVQTGQRITISGSSSNDGAYIVSSYSPGEITVTASSITTEAAGQDVTFTAYFLPDTTAADDSSQTQINHGFTAQIEIEKALIDICKFHEHIFFSYGNTYYVVDKENYLNLLARTGFEIQKDTIDEQVFDIIEKFDCRWTTRISIKSPVKVQEIERSVTVLTGHSTGNTVSVTAFDESESAVLRALQKKQRIYEDYEPLTFTLAGIDNNVKIGSRIDFETSWLTGKLHVQEVHFILSGKNQVTVVFGIAYDVQEIVA